MKTTQIALRNEYNAIDTMSWKIYFTESTLQEIQPLLDYKFLEIWEALIATHQIISVRKANGPEYFEKFILPNIHRSIAWKVTSWILQSVENKKVPTIEQIQANIDHFQEEEAKYSDAEKQFTPEQREARLKQIQEMKNNLNNKIKVEI